MPNPLIVNAFVKRLQKVYTERDKRLHFWISFFLVLNASLVLPGLTVVTALTLSLGFAKELWDELYGTGFCWFDMLANALGAATGAALIYAING